MLLRPNRLALALLASLASAAHAKPVTVAPAVGETCSADGLCLTLTVGRADPANPQACAVEGPLTVDVGDPVSWCYTLRNAGTRTLGFHNVTDSVHGAVLSQLARSLAPGESYSHVRVERAGAATNGAVDARWTASETQSSYTPDDTIAFDYIDAGDGEQLAMTGGFASARSTAVTLPFAIDFFGTITDRLCVGHGGVIVVDTSVCAPPSTFGFPSFYVDKAIAPMWSSFDRDAGTAYIKTIGDPGQRRTVIEWKNYALDFPEMAGFTFEVVFEEATGAIVFNYASTGSGDGAFGDAGEMAAVGLQSSASTGVVYSLFDPNLAPGDAVRFTPAPTQTWSVDASVSVDIGAARLMLPVPALVANAGIGMTIQQPMVVVNTGNRPLTWSAGEYPAAPLAALAPLKLPARASENAGVTRGGRDPNHVLRASPRGAAPLGDWDVPAYGMQSVPGEGLNYVTLDLRNDAALQTIVPAIDQRGFAGITGGDFVDDDFTLQLMIDSDYDRLYRFDTLTGASTLVGWPTGNMTNGFEYWSGVAWDATTDTLYGVTSRYNTQRECFWTGLYTIDTTTAAASYVGPIATGADNCLIDIAVDGNGALFGLDIKTDTLVAIDKGTGQAMTVGALGVDANYLQSIKFDRSTGTLYWAGYAQGIGFVATIDPVTGQPTMVGATPGNREMAAVAIAKAGGDCSQPLDTPWLTIGTTGGTLAPGAPAGVYPLTFDATQLAAGEYHASICVFSNDPAYRARPAVVPVSFTVHAPDAIFANGFE